MNKIIKWLIISLSSLIFIIGIAFLVLMLLLTPKRLTPIVNRYCSEFLNAKVTFDTVQVSLFEEFPKVSVKLVSGEIISYALQSDTAHSHSLPNGVDTLLRFNELMVSLNFKDLLQSKVNIERIRIFQPNINAYISPSGIANFDIIAPSDNNTPLDLNIDRISIRGPANISFNSCPDSIALQASVGRLFLKGKLSLDTESLEIAKFVCSNVIVKANVEKSNLNAMLLLDSAAVDIIVPRTEFKVKVAGAASVSIEKQQYLDSLPLKIDGAIVLDMDKFNFFNFKDFCLTIAQLPELKLNGDLHLSEGEIESDISCRIEKIPLQSLFNLVPEKYSEEIKKIQTNINISLSTKIKGTYEFTGNGKLPSVEVDLKIPKGFLIYKDLESKIDNILVDASFLFDPTSPAKTGINLKTINLDAFAMKLKGNMQVTHLFDDPHITLKMNGEANLKELVKFAPDDLGISARGNISFTADGTLQLSRLTQQDFSKNALVVNVNADKVRVRIPNKHISVLAEKTHLEFNTTKTRTNRNTGKITKILSLEFQSDTARIRLPNRETVALSIVNLSLRSSDALISGESSKVIPMFGDISATTLEYSGVDSTSIRLRDMKSSVRILPTRDNRTLPSIRFEIESKQLSGFFQESRLSVRDANITVTATKNEPLQRREPSTRGRNTDGSRSNRNTDDFRGEDMDFRDAEIGALLRDWTVNGAIKSRSGRIISPLFPLRTRLQNLDITFTTNDITLQNIDIRCGESRLSLSGKVDNIRRALSTGRGLKIEAQIKADTLNFNQLLSAAYQGANYSAASEEYKKAISTAADEEKLEKIIQQENEGKKEKPVLIVVPSNISLDINMNVKHGKYADVVIHKLTGELISRDRCIQLKDFEAKTSLGDINLTALYATRSKKDITFGIDLEFKEIQVEDFIKIIPSIDSLVPMLASFQGVVNTQVAATASMDTMMNIILPSLNAACRISGKNMVLLDGETFSEIAKTLKFKNKERNLVDNISVELLINNHQIEIFPFIMEIDRYRTAISGVHNLDMTFDYHISVLKSPIPFRLGINLTGDLDNMSKMKFGIGQAKYKDTNLPTYVTLIDATRLNLRTQINNFIQQGVDVARFSQFSAPKIDPTLVEKEVESFSFSAQDSLALYKEGIIKVAPKLPQDSVPADESKPKRGRGIERY